MGLADFLAQAGRGSVVGNIAQAFGGQTTGQAAYENFVNNELPKLYDQAKSATDENGMHQFIMNFAAKAAPIYGVDGALKLAKEFSVPLMQGMQANAIDKVKNDYAPRTTATVPVDYGQPGQVRGPDIITPGKPYDLQGAFGLVSGLTRAGAPMEPAGIQQTLETPGNIDYKAAQTAQEQQKTSQAQTTEAARQREIGRLSDTPMPGTSLSERGLATLAPATGLTQLLPQRADPLDEARKGLIAAQTAHAQAATGAAGREGRGSQMMQDFIRSGGDPNDRQGFIDFSTGVVGAKQPPAKPETDIQLRTAYEKAAIDREKLRRGMLNPVGWAEGQTEGYNAADAQLKALEAEMQNRGLLPTTSQPTPPPKPIGRGNALKPKGNTPTTAAAGPSPEEVKAAKKRLGLIK